MAILIQIDSFYALSRLPEQRGEISTAQADHMEVEEEEVWKVHQGKHTLIVQLQQQREQQLPPPKVRDSQSPHMTLLLGEWDKIVLLERLCPEAGTEL